MLDLFAGVWSYRTLQDNPQAVDDLARLLVAQGEMVLEPLVVDGTLTGQIVFRSSPPLSTDARLAVSGRCAGNDVQLRGTGVAGTAAEGWIYDFEGRIAQSWPGGVGQRPVLVGSVVRTAAHAAEDGNIAPAGVVFTFVAVKRDFLEARHVIPLPDATRDMLASAGHRLQHAVWHTVRGAWLGLRPAQQRDIHALKWAPGAPKQIEGARPAVDGSGPILTNGSGEDFLFMHRQMIRMVADSAGKDAPRAWRSIPAPGPLAAEPPPGSPNPQFKPVGNPDGFTVPPAWIDPEDPAGNRRISALKGDEYFFARMASWERDFKNPAHLSSLSLGALGALLEFTVHNAMHMRWSSVARDPETGEPVPAARPDHETDGKWLRPEYDFLGEFFSSHVHPVFWSLHGWVDARIDDWAAAHKSAHADELMEQDHGGVKWFAPGKWVAHADPWSGPADQTHHGHHHFDEAAMREVLRIVARPASEDKPAPTEAAPHFLALRLQPGAEPGASLLRTFSRPWFPGA